MWEKNLKGNGCVFTYDGITLTYSRNYHPVAKHLYLSKTLKNGLRNEAAVFSGLVKVLDMMTKEVVAMGPVTAKGWSRLQC